ncbi:MAG: hypothetical protein WDN10_02775 [bacterium]
MRSRARNLVDYIRSSANTSARYYQVIDHQDAITGKRFVCRYCYALRPTRLAIDAGGQSGFGDEGREHRNRADRPHLFFDKAQSRNAGCTTSFLRTILQETMREPELISVATIFKGDNSLNSS